MAEYDPECRDCGHYKSLHRAGKFRCSECHEDTKKRPWLGECPKYQEELATPEHINRRKRIEAASDRCVVCDVPTKGNVGFCFGCDSFLCPEHDHGRDGAHVPFEHTPADHGAIPYGAKIIEFPKKVVGE